MKYLFLLVAVWLAVIVGAIALYYTVQLVMWITDVIDERFEYYKYMRELSKVSDWKKENLK